MPSFSDVERLLSDRRFRVTAAGFDRRQLITSANQIGPRMRLLAESRLAELGHLPDFAANETVDALDAINYHRAPLVEIFMVSHRWLRPHPLRSAAHPDDTTASKARSLLEFFRWRKRWVTQKHGFEPIILMWIDYSCFDHDHIDRDLSMLPVWVACCERVLRVETPDYDTRAWCRLEALLTHAFQFTDHQVSIPVNYRFVPGDDGVAVAVPINDPAKGRTTDAADAARIQKLAELAYRNLSESAPDRAILYRFGTTNHSST